MTEQPVLTTKRLELRPFKLVDSEDVRKLAGDWNIADTTINLPHPYSISDAQTWIATHAELYAKKENANYAVAERTSQRLLGAIGLTINIKFCKAELGYWIGKPFWGKGFCTEASYRMLEFGFDELGLNRIYAHHFTRNPASGRVLEKIGMICEGCLRQTIKKWDKFEDIKTYGILKSEYCSKTDK